MTSRRAVVVLALATAAAIAACAGSAVRERTRTVDTMIETARDHGAMRCAPVELAMAESHNDFAKQELSEGNYYPARHEAEVARTNAQAAIDRSPKDRCNPGAAPPAPTIGDADGDGILDNVDECPKVPEDKDGYQDEDGCPEDDNDGDGIADKIDNCPNEPEDKDGFEDTDGCPDNDNDGDGIADRIDQCPDQAEDKDGFEDDDGCPDCDDDQDGVPECPEALDKCPGEKGEPPDGCAPKYTMIVVTPTKIELKQTIYFDTRKAKIKKISYPLLDEVAQALTDRPTMEVSIEGHTDSQGSDKFNLKLSRDRAASVRNYLISKGVDGARMVTQGFGESVPIADNRTAAGRAENRRVEFLITHP
ncbi:MAG TPA: OmpA family protein [Kofleriaceae bacterium]|nr:OmpA family protein [Kofleriaceae bacterium]